ncbi:Methylenetetrahydrofolate reductase 1 [Capsicum chinense]|nr:Methylenetetrahydrofolate reductase 1 [Capsicum chinense]
MMTNEVLELIGTQGIGASRILAGKPGKASHFANMVDARADLIITQLFYDIDIFLKFVNDCRQIETNCPIVPETMVIAAPVDMKAPTKLTGKGYVVLTSQRKFKVEINFSAKIPMQAIANALHGQESGNSQVALRVLDIILRLYAAKQVKKSIKLLSVYAAIQVCRGSYLNLTGEGAILKRLHLWQFSDNVTSKDVTDLGTWRLPPVSHAQLSIVVDTLQHASGSTPGPQCPNTFNIHFLTPQQRTTTCLVSPTVHAFAVPPPPKALA